MLIIAKNLPNDKKESLKKVDNKDKLLKAKKNMEKYFNKKDKDLRKEINFLLKKKKWNEAYIVYTTIINEVGLKAIIYEYLIILLVAINKITILTNDILQNILILITNYFNYFQNSKDTLRIVESIMIFIRKHGENIYLNEMNNFIGIFFNHLYDKYKSNNMYVKELIELNKIQDKCNLLYISNLFIQYQIIGAINYINNLMKTNTSDDFIRLKFKILLIFKQYKAAKLFLDSLQNNKLVDEFTQILNALKP